MGKQSKLSFKLKSNSGIAGKMFHAQLDDLADNMKPVNKYKDRLREMDLFVLDNSLRETTVGQLRGHTLENKWEIYEQIKKIGFSDVFVAAFNHQTRVADTFIKQLQDKGEDMTRFWAFTEFVDEVDENKVPIEDLIPIGLQKCKQLGIPNVMIELDVNYYGIDYDIFDEDRLCNLLHERIRWIRENLSPKSKIFVNFRDMCTCMTVNPRRVFEVVNFLSSLPKEEQIMGIAYEEMGDFWHDQIAVWTKCVRKEMVRCGWESGHFIVHVHEQFGLANSVVLDCLAAGATGIWAGICEEGARLGHASTCLSILNLIRLGNEKVLKKFNCVHLRAAARRITEIVTTKPPPCKQPICGDRALDLVFGLESMVGDVKMFDMAEFFGEKAGIRITTLASPPMIIKKLELEFGQDKNFTLELATAMKDVMLQDLHANRKEEYNSAVGLALLFDRAGGKLTEAMSDTIEKIQDIKKYSAVGLALLFDRAGGKLTEAMPDAIEKEAVNSPFMEKLIGEVRAMWDEWDMKDGVMDDELDFFAFYNGFMAPYFGCYRCDETKKALKCIDMDNDGTVDWKEFAVYLKWAANQYPDTKTAQELLDIAFRKGILPAMQDEIVKDLPGEQNGEVFET